MDAPRWPAVVDIFHNVLSFVVCFFLATGHKPNVQSLDLFCSLHEYINHKQDRFCRHWFYIASSVWKSVFFFRDDFYFLNTIYQLILVCFLADKCMCRYLHYKQIQRCCKQGREPLKKKVNPERLLKLLLPIYRLFQILSLYDSLCQRER